MLQRVPRRRGGAAHTSSESCSHSQPHMDQDSYSGPMADADSFTDRAAHLFLLPYSGTDATPADPCADDGTHRHDVPNPRVHDPLAEFNA